MRLPAWPSCNRLLAPSKEEAGLAAPMQQTTMPSSAFPLACRLQLTTRSSPPFLRLRLLDISSACQLSDLVAAQLLCTCPQLRVLHAAGCSQLGPTLLAALAGRVHKQDTDWAEQVVQQHACRRHERGHECANSDSDPQQCDAGSANHEASMAAARGLLGHWLCDAAALRAARAAALHPGAAPFAQPACPLLEALDLSECATRGSALRRALRCLPHLRSLALNGCSGVGGLLEPLLAAGDGAGSSQAARVGALLAGLAALTRLEALDSDMQGRHVQALLGHCTALRRLALSGRQLAAEGFDRQQHDTRLRSAGSSGDVLPSLVWLEVGWGTGGTFLLHLVQRHCPHLAALAVHVGAAASDWHLERLVASCPHLGRLCLRGTNVSETGEAAGTAGMPGIAALLFPGLARR